MTTETIYVRNPAIAATEIDEETFLVEPDDGEVFYLDEVSSALWRFLDQERGRGEILEVFKAAFPDVTDTQIDADIEAALSDMVERGLAVVRTS